MSAQTLHLSRHGMTCANCAATVERIAKSLDGVEEARVNFASEQAAVTFDPKAVTLPQILGRIQAAGYAVPTARVDLAITGMTCANCAATIERTLNKKVPGVVQAAVNFATERAAVEYRARRRRGRRAHRRGGRGRFRRVARRRLRDAEDAEAAARAAGDRATRRASSSSGVACSAAAVPLSMARDFGLLGDWSHAAWVNWLFFALATPVQFYTGLGLLRGRVQEPAQPQRQHGRAGRAGLLGRPTSTRSAVLLAPGLGHHVYFETSAVIITLIKLGKMLEVARQGPHRRGHPQADRACGPRRPSCCADGVESGDPGRAGARRATWSWSGPASASRWTARVAEGDSAVDESHADRRVAAGRQAPRATRWSAATHQRPGAARASRPRARGHATRSWRRSSAWCRRPRAARRRSSAWPTGWRRSSCRSIIALALVTFVPVVGAWAATSSPP